MENYSVQAVLSVADKNFTSKMKSATNSLSELEKEGKKANSSIMDIAKGVGVFKALAIAGNVLKDSLAGAIDRFDTMERYPKIMKNMGFSAEASNKSIRKLSEGIQQVPTSLDGIVASTQKIALLTNDLEKATDTSLALNNAFFASGASAADAERGVVQYTQMLSKGTVDIQSWRTLQETMGYALSEVAKELGITSGNTTELYDAIQSGIYSFDDMNAALIKCSERTGGFAEKAKLSSAGIRTSFTNLGIAVTRGMADTIKAVDTSMNKITGSGIQGKVEQLTGTVDTFFDGVEQGAGTAVVVLDALGPSLLTVATGFITMKTAMAGVEKMQTFTRNMGEAKSLLDAYTSSQKLSAKASELREKAIRAEELAQNMAVRAEMAAEQALKSDTAASKLAKEAIKAKAKADKTSVLASDLRAKSQEKNVIATHAAINADKDSIKATTAKANATSAERLALKSKTKAEVAAAAAEEASNTITEKGNLLMTTKAAVLGVLSGQINLVTAAQLAWNAATAAQKVGIAIAGLTALIVVIKGTSDALKKLCPEADNAIKKSEDAIGSSKDLASSLSESKKAFNDTSEEIQANAKVTDDLVGKVINLTKKENKNASEKAELRSYVDALNSSMDGLNLQIDEETGQLNMSTDALLKKAEAYKKAAEAAATQERYLEVKKEQIKIEEELDSLAKSRNTFEKEWQNLNNTGPQAMSKYNEKRSEMAEQEQSLIDKKKELATSEEFLAGRMTELSQEQAAATQESVGSQITSFKDLSESQQGVVESMNASWQSYMEQATNMFDALSDKSEISVGEMTTNLLENQRVMDEWATNLSILADRHVNQGLLETLKEAGPKSAGYVKAMATATDTELIALCEAYEQAGTSATNAFKASIDNAEIPISVMNMVTSTKESLASQIAAADFAGISSQVPAGFAQGITENAGMASESSRSMAEGISNAAKDELGTHSPSTVFKQIGTDCVTGYAIGVTNAGGQAESAITSVFSNAGKQAAAAFKMNLTEMMTINSTAFAQITASTEKGMQEVSKAVEMGSKRSDMAFKAGMKGMQASTESGMSAVKATVSAKCNSIVAETAKLQTRFYQSGVYASQGLARGINAGAPSAIAAARRVANQVASIMAQALQEHSPSRRTRKIGAYASEGLELGILDKIHQVEQAARTVAEAAVPTGDIANKMMASFHGVTSTSASFAYAGSTSEEYTIIVPVEIDGREVARSTAVYTREEINKIETKNRRKRGFR